MVARLLITPAAFLLIVFALTINTPPARSGPELQMLWRIQKVGQLQSEGRSCTVTSLGNDIVAQLSHEPGHEEPAWSVVVGYDNAPKSLRYLRVDREIFVTDEVSFRGPEAEEIVTLLRKPGEFSFEWARDPDYAKQQGLFGTGDFADKAAACADWVSRDRI